MGVQGALAWALAWTPARQRRVTHRTSEQASLLLTLAAQPRAEAARAAVRMLRRQGKAAGDALLTAPARHAHLKPAHG